MAMSKLVENGTRIFGGNLAIENSLSLDNTIYGIQRYATLTGVNLVPFFLSGSEKVAKASILASINTSKLVSSYEHKCELYKAIGIPIVPQAAKTTGFERLKDYYDLFPERVSKQEKIAYSKYPSKRVFDQLFRYRYLIQLNNQYVPNLVVRGI
jgi:hypothetical protein